MTRLIIPLSQDVLKDTFDYHPDGYLIWKKPKVKWVKIGSKAGWDRGDGYQCLGFGGKHHLLHRLIYLYHHGDMPDLIDHIDQDHTNNRIENLRPSDKKENVYNTSKLWGHNTSGVRGVSWDTKQQKWSVRFKHEGKYLFFGYFLDLEEAKMKRQEIERRYLGDG